MLSSVLLALSAVLGNAFTLDVLDGACASATSGYGAGCEESGEDLTLIQLSQKLGRGSRSPDAPSLEARAPSRGDAGPPNAQVMQTPSPESLGLSPLLVSVVSPVKLRESGTKDGAAHAWALLEKARAAGKLTSGHLSEAMQGLAAEAKDTTKAAKKATSSILLAMDRLTALAADWPGTAESERRALGVLSGESHSEAGTGPVPQIERTRQVGVQLQTPGSAQRFRGFATAVVAAISAHVPRANSLIVCVFLILAGSIVNALVLIPVYVDYVTRQGGRPGGAGEPVLAKPKTFQEDVGRTVALHLPGVQVALGGVFGDYYPPI